MRLRIRSQDLEVGPRTRQGLGRSLRLALARHSSRIRLVSLSFSPGAPMHGEGTLRCEMRLHTREGEVFSLEEHATDVRLAAARAAQRMDQRLDRQRFRGGFPMAQEARQ